MQTALTTFTSGILIVALGTVLKYKSATYLISGFESENISDEEGLSDFIGLNAIYVGALTMTVGLIEYSMIETRLCWYIFTVAVVIILLRMVIGSRKYR